MFAEVDVDDFVADGLGQLRRLGVVDQDDQGRLFFRVHAEMALDLDNCLLAIGDGIDALDVVRNRLDYGADQLLGRTRRLGRAGVAEDHVRTELVDDLPQDAAALDDFDGRFDFVLAVVLLERDRLAGRGR